jgi:hypothetical protein
MIRKIFALVAVVSAAFVCSAQAAVIYSTWDGGGIYDDWDNANNWDPNVVPNNGTDTYVVTIDAGAGEVKVGLRERSTIDQLDCYGEIYLFEGSHSWQNEPIKLILVNPSGLTNHGDLVIDELDITGNVTNASGAGLELEDVDIEGDLYNQAGATVEVFREDSVNQAVENAGLILVHPAGELYADNSFDNLGEVLVYGGAFGADEDILDNNDTGLIKGFGVVRAEQLLRNKGRIYAYGGSLAVKCEGPVTNTGTLGNMCLSTLYINPAEDVNNQGNIEIKPGGGVAFDCNLVNEPNATIQLYGGTLALNNATVTQKAGATFEGFGTISSGSGGIVIKPNAEIKFTASTNIVGNVEIDEDATLEINDGLTLVTGQTVCNGTIHMKGGYIVTQGGLSGDCNVVWEPGLYTNASDFNLDGQVNFEDFAYMADTWLWQTAWQ